MHKVGRLNPSGKVLASKMSFDELLGGKNNSGALGGTGCTW